ncbi:hypothetical protein GIB67_038098 [Kingdonia uniflora]|uniref:Purple acid phosphatase n=1 Tax=Kingdonia uniflora TaxID=39325 RepID=A0A7J7P8P9_9MAGN|nr:hypothetical protein GIB67_038098 [Kingdonia uniflora]
MSSSSSSCSIFSKFFLGFYILLILFGSSSALWSSLPSVVSSLPFRTLNRRSLLPCPDPNPYIQVNISSDSELKDDDQVTVTVSGVLFPADSDWVAMVSPAHSDVTNCPLSAWLYKQTGDLSDLPLLCHYPVKAQYMSNDPDYLDCKKKECQKYEAGVCVVHTCSGSVTFHVVNIRTDIGFLFFADGFDTPCILGRSRSVSFANPNSPLYGHLSSVDSTGTSMKLTWVSGDKEPQEIQYGDGKSQASTVTTFTQDDMCSSGSIKSPAADFGWHDPGYIHSAVMTELEPSRTYSYKYGRDYMDSGSVYTLGDSGGECGVAYETYFPMPTPGKDKPWYSIEQASIHFTVISTEHDWSENSEQYEWMKKDLESVDRSRTPWVIFTGHRPMYSSLKGGFPASVDPKFAEAVEPLLVDNEVTVYLSYISNKVFG